MTRARAGQGRSTRSATVKRSGLRLVGHPGGSEPVTRCAGLADGLGDAGISARNRRNPQGMIFLGLLFVQLQLFEGALEFVPKQALNGGALALAVTFWVLGLGVRGVKKGRWSWFASLLAIVVVQWVHVSWWTVSLSNGLMSMLRYGVYLAILVAFREHISSRVPLRMVASALLVGVGVSVSYGLVTDSYVFLNGMRRFMGGSHSPAGLSLHASACILALLAAGLELRRTDAVMRVLRLLGIAFCVGVLVATGSRQPQLGLVLVGGFWLCGRRPRVAVAIAMAGVVLWFSGGEEGLRLRDGFETLGRSAELVEQLQDVAAAGNLSGLTESSTLSRIDYMRVSWAFVLNEGKLLGGGLNSFARVYERYTGKPGRAPHNDLVLSVMDFGIPGLIGILAVLFWAGVRWLQDRRALTPYALFFWFVVWSLNNPLYYFSVFAPYCVILAVFMTRDATARAGFSRAS